MFGLLGVLLCRQLMGCVDVFALAAHILSVGAGLRDTDYMDTYVRFVLCSLGSGRREAGLGGGMSKGFRLDPWP